MYGPRTGRSFAEASPDPRQPASSAQARRATASARVMGRSALVNLPGAGWVSRRSEPHMHVLAWSLGYLALSFVTAIGTGKLLARASSEYPEAVPVQIPAGITVPAE